LSELRLKTKPQKKSFSLSSRPPEGVGVGWSRTESVLAPPKKFVNSSPFNVVKSAEGNSHLLFSLWPSPHPLLRALRECQHGHDVRAKEGGRFLEGDKGSMLLFLRATFLEGREYRRLKSLSLHKSWSKLPKTRNSNHFFTQPRVGRGTRGEGRAKSACQGNSPPRRRGSVIPQRTDPFWRATPPAHCRSSAPVSPGEEGYLSPALKVDLTCAGEEGFAACLAGREGDRMQED